jgi:hypothetical protein
MPKSKIGKKTKISPFAIVSILLAFGVLAFGLLLSNRQVEVTDSGAAGRPLKVLEIRYLSAPTDVSLVNNVSSQFRAQIVEASKYQGYKNPTSAPQITAVNILRTVTRTGQMPIPSNPGNWEDMYNKILAQDNLCGYITTNRIDHVWLWIDTDSAKQPNPGVEYALSGRLFPIDKAGENQATVTKVPLCGGSRSFVFMGLDYQRNVSEAMHSLGHAFEGMVSYMQGAELFWGRYSGSQKYGTNYRERCGNVHFPPNGAADYDYSNSSNTTSFCEDWKAESNGTMQTFNCTKWNCDHLAYMKWWFQNMPSETSGHTYKGLRLPSWWSFMVDTDTTYANYVSQGFYMGNSAQNLTNSLFSWVTTNVKNDSGTQVFRHYSLGSNKALVVAVSYKIPSFSTTPKINSVTYGGAALTRIRRDQGGQFVTELWYRLNPAASGDVSITYSSNEIVGKAAHALSMRSILQTTPLGSTTGAGASGASDTGNVTSLTIATPVLPHTRPNPYPVPSGSLVTRCRCVVGVGVATSFIDRLETSITIVPDARTGARDISTVQSSELISTLSFFESETTTAMSWRLNRDWPWAASAMTFNRAITN